jgi:peptidyl-tRNA hydrolase, PTH1 family
MKTIKILVGLGNPGIKYEKSRHNVGYILIEETANSLGLSWQDNNKLNAQIAYFDNKILVKPLTSMNLSGECVSKVVSFYKADVKYLTIINDDVDLPFGKIKKQLGSSSAGHHGVDNIIEKLGTDGFWRIRVGIGRPENNNISVMDWVLSDFSSIELEELKKIKIGDYWE